MNEVDAYMAAAGYGPPSIEVAFGDEMTVEVDAGDGASVTYRCGPSTAMVRAWWPAEGSRRAQGSAGVVGAQLVSRREGQAVNAGEEPAYSAILGLCAQVALDTMHARTG